MGLHPADRIREYRDKGFWGDDMIDALLRERVARDGDIPALVDPLNRVALMDGPVRTLTWPQLDERVSRLAQVLLDEGVRPGDVVGVQLPNTVEIVVAFLAIVRIGAIVAPFPVQYRAYELTHLSGVARVQAFLTASRIGQRPAAAELAGLRAQIPSLRWVGAFGADLSAGVIGLDERIEAADDRGGLAAHLAAWSPDPNDCVTICWTSGTESTPKGVQRTHYDWMSMRTGTVEGPDLTADDVLLNPFPMVNMDGINGMFLPRLMVGGLLVQHHPFDLPRSCGRSCSTERRTLARRRRRSPRCCTMRRCWPRPTSPRCASSAPARPAGPTCCRLARQVRRRDHQLLRLQRGHRAARRPQGHPGPGGARAVLPALRRPGLVDHRVPCHAGPDRRPGHRCGARRTAPQPAGQDPRAGTARGAPATWNRVSRPSSARTAAARPAWGCGRRSRSASA